MKKTLLTYIFGGLILLAGGPFLIFYLFDSRYYHRSVIFFFLIIIGVIFYYIYINFINQRNFNDNLNNNTKPTFEKVNNISQPMHLSIELEILIRLLVIFFIIIEVYLSFINKQNIGLAMLFLPFAMIMWTVIPVYFIILALRYVKEKRNMSIFDKIMFFILLAGFFILLIRIL